MSEARLMILFWHQLRSGFASMRLIFYGKVERMTRCPLLFYTVGKYIHFKNQWRLRFPPMCLIFGAKVQTAFIMFLKETNPFKIQLFEERTSNDLFICFNGRVTLK